MVTAAGSPAADPEASTAAIVSAGAASGEGLGEMAIVSDAPAVSTAGLAATWVLPARDHLSEHDSELGLQLGITPQPVGGGEGDPLAQLALDLVADLLQPALTFFTQTHREPSPVIVDALDRTDGDESWVVVLAAKKLIHGSCTPNRASPSHPRR